MKIDRWNPRHWISLLQQGACSLLAILLRPLAGKPNIPVVILYGHQLSGNLRALYQQWQATHTSKMSLHFLCIDVTHSKQLMRQGVNALRFNSLRDVLTLARASVIITDHGLHAMTPLLSLTNIFFVDVWHGIPFKGFIPDDFRLQQRYDEVWVSSPLLKEIYQNKFGFKPEIVYDMGYARTDKLFLRHTPEPLFREKASIPAGNKVVLYAPTWQQDDKGRELFPFGESQESFLRKISEVCGEHKATLVIRSHLNASISAMTFDNVRYCSMKEFPDAEDLLLQTDILICDWSSIAFDFLALDRATIFLDVEPPFKNSFSLSGEYRFGKLVTGMNDLEETLNRILAKPQWYVSTQCQRHRDVTSAVYGKNIDGEVASRQLSRLADRITRTGT